jgi:N-acetylneuraminic acid mutarotase
VQLYFGESPEASEPELLKNIQSAKVWAQIPGGRGGAKMVEVPMTLTEESLSGVVDDKATAMIVSHDYGVVSKGDTPFLLKYLAKQNTSPLPGQWDAVKDADHLPLEITPAMTGSSLKLSVTLKGQPAAGLEVKASGCGLDETLTTDDKGIVCCEPKSNGVLIVRARYVENTRGELEGTKYESVRTYSTLTLPLTLPTIQPVAKELPALPNAVTSFGAAVVGDDVYVYGGHFGDSHHYSDSGQSGDFMRLSLANGKATWESLPGGPKLTGLALVEHAGKLYRVGGFTAKNKENEDQSLWSQESFACFDPASGQWSELAPLPSGRSSHDAAVVDGRLYVVGGWNMQGTSETKWHTSAVVCDLTQPELKWTEIAVPPFQRRAVSLAACKGKLFVVGGMQEDNQITTRVDVFDPATNAWTTAPALHGTGMEGFGTSAFAANDRLVVTTMSGSIQALSEDCSAWQVIGQAAEARFFHRQLTTKSGQILLIAGASMQSGKTGSLELLQMVSN